MVLSMVRRYIRTLLGSFRFIREVINYIHAHSSVSNCVEKCVSFDSILVSCLVWVSLSLTSIPGSILLYSPAL